MGLVNILVFCHSVKPEVTGQQGLRYTVQGLRLVLNRIPQIMNPKSAGLGIQGMLARSPLPSAN